MSLQTEQALEQTYVMPTFARKPVELVRGEGMRVYDDEGREYLDFIAGIGCDSLGHCHPSVVRALEEQAHKLIHVGNYYYIENRGEVALMLSSLLSASAAEAEEGVSAGESAQGAAFHEAPEAWKVFFTNSGAESNECAIKLARLYTRRKAEAKGVTPSADEAPVIITLLHSFHGRTLATLAATAQLTKQEVFQPLPAGFDFSPINDIEALRAKFDEYGDRVCAVMVECIQGESGVHPCTPEFLQEVRALTEERDALLICDEVQTGIFRTGKPFGFQNFGITPDIVSMAKGIASGFPMGACAALAHVADAFHPGDHGTTFGGSNLAIACAKATLTELSSEGFAASVCATGEYFRQRLAALDALTEVRGYGLMVGADLADPAIDAFGLAVRGLDRGLLLNATGPHTLRFLPPLICTNAEIDVLVERLSTLLS